MGRYCIITNFKKDPKGTCTERVRTYLERHGHQCVLNDGKEQLSEEEFRDCTCILVLGGDGTLVATARHLTQWQIPLIGVNIGTLGYLAEIEEDRIEQALDQIMAGSGIVEKRMMLEGKFSDGMRQLALNDVVITRSGSMHIINFSIFVNGRFLNDYRADGMIFSTPTGSTAYNLSAGGPIVDPTAPMIVVTPICPHTLGEPSFVLSSEDEISIEISENNAKELEVVAAFDGANPIPIGKGERLLVKKAEETTSLMKLHSQSFLKILRKKMKG